MGPHPSLPRGSGQSTSVRVYPVLWLVATYLFCLRSTEGPAPCTIREACTIVPAGARQHANRQGCWRFTYGRSDAWCGLLGYTASKRGCHSLDGPRCGDGGSCGRCHTIGACAVIRGSH